jgi:hypothetical protein
MPDYSKGKIYKLYNEDNPDECYIGSTVSRLSHRYNQHLSDYNINQRVSSKKLFENKIPIIMLIEDYSCKSLFELKLRERYWIEQYPNSVNKAIPTRTKQEYYQDTKEIRTKQHKDYLAKRKANKELKEYILKN